MWNFVDLDATIYKKTYLGADNSFLSSLILVHISQTTFNIIHRSPYFMSSFLTMTYLEEKKINTKIEYSLVLLNDNKNWRLILSGRVKKWTVIKSKYRERKKIFILFLNAM